jgi:NAD(P)H-dependent FMN reductase
LNILALSGSLRARSTNTEVLRAAAILAPATVQLTLYSGLASIPPFNPDLDFEGAILPAPVQDLRRQIARADAVLICSPEYAHGVPGVLKNALDWLVSGTEIVHKPVALLNASPRSTHAQASLAEILRTMSAHVVADASVELPMSGRTLDAAGIAEAPDLADRLRGALDAIARAAADQR